MSLPLESIMNGGDLAMMDFDFSQSDTPVQCPLCTEMFIVVPDDQPLRQHLLTQHSFVIDKIDAIADIRQYLLYWGKLKGADLTQFCSVILTNSEQAIAYGKPGRYFFLSEHLPEDKRIRNMLWEMKLKAATRAKELERADTTFSRKCVYCYDIIEGGLHNMFDHLTNLHSFTIGKPDNIVFGAKLLDAIEAKLQNLLCLYCEKKFTDVDVLRLHMRKKGHRTLNPNNRFYDQFYLITYLQPGTPWQKVKFEKDEESEVQDSFNDETIAGGVGISQSLDDQWTDWRDEESQSAKCLFCCYTTSHLPNGLLMHMTSQHNCDLLNITQNFSFYDKVKAVNYIRSKISELQCPSCGKQHVCDEALQEHLADADHCKLPTPALWCTHKFLQPVMVEDGLLCHLDDSPEAEDSVLESECEVFSEDVMRSDPLSGEVAREFSAEVKRGSSVSVLCLFCRFTALGGPTVGCNGVRELADHMHNMHGFDLFQVTLGKSFYEQLCLINFIRSCSKEGRCYCCGEHFSDPRYLEEHRSLHSHTGLPPQHLYNQSTYMTPVIEDDPLLQGLDQLCWNSDSDLEEDTPPRGKVSPTGNSKKSSRNKHNRHNKQNGNDQSYQDERPDYSRFPNAARSIIEDMNASLKSASNQIPQAAKVTSVKNTSPSSSHHTSDAQSQWHSSHENSVDSHSDYSENFMRRVPNGANVTNGLQPDLITDNDLLSSKYIPRPDDNVPLGAGSEPNSRFGNLSSNISKHFLTNQDTRALPSFNSSDRVNSIFGSASKDLDSQIPNSGDRNRIFLGSECNSSSNNVDTLFSHCSISELRNSRLNPSFSLSGSSAGNSMKYDVPSYKRNENPFYSRVSSSTCNGNSLTSNISHVSSNNPHTVPSHCGEENNEVLPWRQRDNKTNNSDSQNSQQLYLPPAARTRGTSSHINRSGTRKTREEPSQRQATNGSQASSQWQGFPLPIGDPLSNSNSISIFGQTAGRMNQIRPTISKKTT